ncbi:MAG: CpaF family protein [Actinomycetia bacterium]|nr:CpaF family protein [Actinomycetes bacterium]MCP4225004.1 CpaF family protein [Actinomycetes bacterium]MCP5034632.1 CpaF family protein [Actinomycetes bacterium]
MTLGRRLALRASATGAPTRQFRDPLTELRDRTRETLARDLGKKLGGSEHDAVKLKSLVTEELDRMISDSSRLLTTAERAELASTLIDDVLGYGPIEPLLADPSVSEVMVNGTDAIFVERGGQIELTTARFRSEEHLRQIIVRIAAAVGRRVDESSPMVDARLADGSRVNAVIPPLAVDGPALTIRKFGADTLTAHDLVEGGSLTQPALDLLSSIVLGKLNIIVSGGTGTGKTTFLNVLSSFIPPTDRIVTIEDAVELRLRQRHVVRLETKTANIEGRGAIGTRELVRNSLRMRPDRIIVGECRGAEALDMLQAMNTGHDGSLGTLHANNAEDALTRLETMVLMAGLDLPSRAIREQLASAIDVIVQLERLRDGARVVSSIAEVIGYTNDRVRLNVLFQRHYDEQSGKTSELRQISNEPHFTQKLAKAGVTLDS